MTISAKTECIRPTNLDRSTPTSLPSGAEPRLSSIAAQPDPYVPLHHHPRSLKGIFMSNVVTFPEAASKPAPSARYETVAGYSSVGPVTVSLVRRLDAMAGLINVVVIGQLQGVEIIATLPDDEKGRAVADFTGPAALRAVELAETEFAAACPEAC